MRSESVPRLGLADQTGHLRHKFDTVPMEPTISFTAPTLAQTAEQKQPRAVGVASLSCKLHGRQTVLDKLHQKGSLKLLFPRTTGAALTGVVLNTAGGITGGDHFELSASTAPGCHLVMTTQAAERAYRAQPGETGTLQTRLTIGNGGRIDWLPQETLLYENASLQRRLRVDMTRDSTFLMVEPVVFGRMAMGETLRQLVFRDRVDVRRDGETLFADRTILNGDAVATLAGSATGAGCGAMVSVMFAAPNAEHFLAPARALMPPQGGVSLIRDGLLFARILAEDGFALRQTLVPLIELISAAPLPRTWMI